jgi:hypothetical protein
MVFDVAIIIDILQSLGDIRDIGTTEQYLERFAISETNNESKLDMIECFIGVRLGETIEARAQHTGSNPCWKNQLCEFNYETNNYIQLGIHVGQFG